MEYKIVSGGSPSDLTTKVNERIKDGWELVGSHQVVIHREQNRFSGQQHMDTLNQLEYSQTMCKKTETPKNVIEVDIMFNHPDDDETIKVYDVEGMREEFEYELQHLLNQDEND
jgi:allophanate hydrolase subunit 1